MNTLIEKIEMEGLFGKKNILWNLRDVNVLVGKNGAGKSTLLKSIHSTLRQESIEELTRSDSLKITLKGGGTITHVIKKLETDANELIKIISEMIKKTKKDKKRQKENEKFQDMINKLLSQKEIIKEVGFGEITVSEDLRDKPRLRSELISTVNMSANSVQELKGSDGEITTILDMEIKSELYRLKQIFKESGDDCLKIQKKLESTINTLFAESSKEIKFDSGDIQINRTDASEELTLSDLSSGERQLIYILLKAANTSQQETVLLMDEPEISLHLSWQEKLISSIIAVNDNCQIIIATHSPAIVMKGWMGSFVDIKDIEVDK